MLRKINLFIFFISSLVLSSHPQSQEKINEYEPPKVIEGSNLSLYASPYLQLVKENTNNSKNAVLGYYIDLHTSYMKWRFTEKTDYTIIAGASSLLYKATDDIPDSYYSVAYLETRTGISRYLLKNKIFIGDYTYIDAQFDSYRKPGYNLTTYPYVGFGRITDAFIINETSNFENVLKDESYITKPFDKKTRLLLNSLLDKRNGSVFRSLYKGDDEIEFFTALEKLLLEEKIIDKPLNARVTMKLYRTLYDRNFILFPLYKGYQVQAEYQYTLDNSDDTLKFPQTLSLNSAYGLPFSNRTALLFTANFVIPLNSEYNDYYYSFNLHSPQFMRYEFEQFSNFGVLLPWAYENYRKKYSYKIAGAVNLFHYITPNIGIDGLIGYTGSHRKVDNYTDYVFIASSRMVFNIIDKLRLSSGLYFRYNDLKEFNINFNNSISYYIF